MNTLAQIWSVGDAVSRAVATRVCTPRSIQTWKENESVRKRFGVAVEKAARDLVAVQSEIERLRVDSTSLRARHDADARARAEVIIQQAQKNAVEYERIKRELCSLLGVSDNASVFGVRQALTTLRAEMNADARVEAANRLLLTARRALEGALSSMPNPIEEPRHVLAPA